MEEIKFEKVRQMAIECIKQTGKHIPQAIVQTSKGYAIIGMIFSGDAEKDRAIEILRNLVYEEQSQHYFFITEAWKSEGTPFLRPSENKNRKEVLIIQEFRRDMNHKISIIPIIRGENGVELREEQFQEQPKELNSIWNVYLEREGINEGMRNRIDKATEEFLKGITQRFLKKYPMDKLKTMPTEELLMVMHNFVDKEIKNSQMEGKNADRKITKQ